MADLTERRIHAAFEIGVILKGVNALLECVGGVALFFVSPQTIVTIVEALVHSELLEDPRDIVANALLGAAKGLSLSGERFAVWYLISHGAVKLVLVAGLLRDKVWAYPASIVTLGLFIAYQLYRLTFAPSLALVVLTVFDVVVVGLIWHEYRLIRRHLPRT
jgi:uncharacterized membrane protein